MKHREQRKRKQRNPLDAIHDQSDVEEHLAVGLGGVFGLVQWTRRGEAAGVGEVVGGNWIVRTGMTCTSSTARVGGVG